MSFVEWLWTIGSIGSLIALAVVLVDTELIYHRIRSQRDDLVWIRVPAAVAAATEAELAPPRAIRMREPA